MKDLAPLWQIEDELSAMLDSMDTCPEELRPELEARIVEYLGHEVEKVDRIQAVLASLYGISVCAKSEIERLRVRQSSAERATARLEDYVLRILRQRGQPLKGHHITFSIRRSESLVIVNPELVPDCWKRTTVSVDIPKDPLKRALKAGENIPGVIIQTNEHLVKR